MNIRPAVRGARSRQGRLVVRFLSTLAIIATVLGAPGRLGAAEGTPAPGERTGPRDVILATTTSTQDSGLLDALVPLFEEQTGYELKPVAVGSGAALKLGEEGEADVLLVHSPQAEQTFMTASFGVDREIVMYNDFVIVGPDADPARIRGETSAVEAMRRIAAVEATFVSRGDDSGTHALERRLWEVAGIEPAGSWYQESGTGMGDTLNIANERDGYTLADRGTFLALRHRLDLAVLVEGDRALLNVYHIITVNPNNGVAVNSEGARAFVTFLLDPATQAVIGGFGADRFGQPLFIACARNSCGLEPAATPTATPPP